MKYGQGADDRLKRGCCAERVAQHRLDGADWDAVRRVLEDSFDRHRFQPIIGSRPGPVGADVAYVLRVEAAVVESFLHRARRAGALWVCRCYMVSVTGLTITDDFGVDARAPPDGARERL